MSDRARKKALAWAKPLFGIALLVGLATQVDGERMAALLRRGDPVRLALALVSFVGALAGFQAARLHVLVKRYTGSVMGSLRLFFVGAFFNNLLPSNVGGDAVRLVYLRRRGDGDWAAPLALLMMHRFSGLLALGLAFLVYAPLRHERLRAVFAELSLDASGSTVAFGALALVAALGAFAALARTGPGARIQARLRAFSTRFMTALAELSRGSLLALAWLTVAFHACRMLGFYLCVAFFGEQLAFWDLIPVLMVTAVVALIPLTVGGLGLVEGSLSVGLALFGVNAEAAVGVALVHRAALLLVALAGGLVYLLQRDENP